MSTGNTFIYQNFFTVCALIPTAFMLTLAIVFMIIQKKSRATFHFGVTFIYMTLFYLGYLVAAMVYHPAAAYHRVVTILVINPLLIHLALGAYYFPDERNVKFGRVLGLALYVIHFIIAGIMLWVLFHSGKVFHFAGHYWDFDADRASKYFGVVILIYFLCMPAVGIWRVIVTRTRERWIALALPMIVYVTTMVPAVINTLSRDGLIDRGTYQVTQDLFTITGFFIFTILYLNATKDRTNFMVRILGISFATFLIVFQALSYFSLRDLDDAYDSLRRRDLLLALETERSPGEVRYITEYRPGSENPAPDIIKGIKGLDVDFSSLGPEYCNTIQYERIHGAVVRKQGLAVENALYAPCPFFRGYRDTILNAGEISGEKKIGAGDALALCLDLQPRILYTANKIRSLDENDFRERVARFMAGMKPELKYFRKAMEEYLRTRDLQGEALRAGLLKFLAPMTPAGTRRYRRSRDGMTHYTAFMHYDPAGDRIVEGGFSYRAYREFLDPTATKYVVILGIILLVIFVGYQFFFLRAFAQPLRNLREAMYRVGKGDYDVTVPVRVSDELGYITGNFNAMVETIKTSKEALAEYAENLETMVEERTSELKQARDALWGEMELAKKIQTILLPRNPHIEGYEISGYMKPADEVGGDYYDIINAEGLDWVVIGDVSGHGVPAGIIMMMVQTAIHTVLKSRSNLKPSVLLDRINSVITENIRRLNEDKYMTITVMACLKNGKFHYSGLHQDIMIYRAEKDEVELVQTDGMWIGIMYNIRHMLREDTIDLKPGDTMLLYTDGITEAWKRDTVVNKREPETDMFGEERLKSVLHENRKLGTEGIRDAIIKALEDYEQSDDVTIVILRKTG